MLFVVVMVVSIVVVIITIVYIIHLIQFRKIPRSFPSSLSPSIILISVSLCRAYLQFNFNFVAV